jgi:hypothetical protein
MSDTIYLRDIKRRHRIFTVWEKHRHGKAHWFVELFAEAVRPFTSIRELVLSHIAVAGCLSLLVIHGVLNRLQSSLTTNQSTSKSYAGQRNVEA